MSFSKRSLGKRLAQLRAQAGLSQRDCARVLDVTDKAVSKWETGAAFPSMDSMVRIAQLYGIELSELFAGAEGNRGPVSLIALEGPSSPVKRSALKAIAEQLEMRGYRVVEVDNAASGLAASGAGAALCGEQTFCIQSVLLQIAHEEAALSAARAMNAPKTAVLCDGSVLDAQRNAKAVDFTVALRAAGISENQARTRYDVLLSWEDFRAHRGNAAMSPADEPTSPTPRNASAPGEQRSSATASETDRADADAAVANAVAKTLAALDEGAPFGREHVLLVRKPARTVLDAQADTRCCTVATDFIAAADGSCLPLAQREESGARDYRLDGAPVDESSYRALLTLADPRMARVQKERWSIPGGASFTCIDRYPFMPYTALARVRTNGAAGALAVPPFLNVVREVTGSSRFAEATFARDLKLGRL